MSKFIVWEYKLQKIIADINFSFMIIIINNVAY